MDFEELKKQWSPKELRLVVKMSAIEVLRGRGFPQEYEQQICEQIDEMTEDEIYKRAYESYLNMN